MSRKKKSIALKKNFEQYGVLLTGILVMTIFLAGMLYFRPKVDKTQIETNTTAVAGFNLLENGGTANEDKNNITLDKSPTWFGTGKFPQQSYTGLIFDTTDFPAINHVKSARLKVSNSKGQYINVSAELFAEMSPMIQEFSEINPPSIRQPSVSSLEYNSNEEWIRNTAYYFDVTDLVNEYLSVYENPSRIAIIFKGTGSQPFGRKFFVTNNKETQKTATLLVEYETENIRESLMEIN